VNLEDISALVVSRSNVVFPSCAHSDFHDDQHGTAVVVVAALLNALRFQDSRWPTFASCNSVSARRTAIAKLLMKAGATDIVGATEWALHAGQPDLSPEHQWFATSRTPRRFRSLQTR